jgi:peptidoglycan hydrolase-like protein with peptidoglycan-binding domain
MAFVVLVGAGSCAFEPRDGRAGAGATPPATAGATTGASASPGPGQGGGIPAPTPTTGAPKPTTSHRPPPPEGCPQGDDQRAVEGYLAQLGGFGPVTVDGKQSTADCAAIKKFQQRYGISPAEGRAGPTTANVARRLATTRTAECETGPGTTICVNLTLQTVWVMRDGKVVMAPTVTRTGMPGFRTPSGTFVINDTNVKEWSTPYKVWLPYWQHFFDGMGFHETTTYIHNMSIGSHGCVNLLRADAQRLWTLGGVGTQVYLFGKRAGT